MIAKLAAKILKSERMAVTIRNTIYLYKCKPGEFLKDKAWVRHEVAHVMQYKRMGSLVFLAAYAWQCMIKGYVSNKFEKEAREREQEPALLEGIHFV